MFPLDFRDFGPVVDWALSLFLADWLLASLLLIIGVLVDSARQVGGQKAELDNGFVIAAIAVASVPFLPFYLFWCGLKPLIRAYYRRKDASLKNKPVPATERANGRT